MEKVVFFTEAGKTYGLGHLTRCVALGDAFEKEGFQIQLLIQGVDPPIDICKNHPFRQIDWYPKTEKILDGSSTASIAVIDSYHAPVENYDHIRKKFDIALYFDDDHRIIYPPGIVINSALGAEHLDYPPKNQVHYLLGSQYQPIRKSFWNVSNKKIPTEIKNIIVMMGGSDTRNLTHKIVVLLKEHHPSLHKDVIIGRSSAQIKKILNLADTKTRVIVNPVESDLFNLYHNADLAISAGGQTLSELARFNIPSVTVGVAENQRHNLSSWQETGFTDFAGWWNDPSVFNNLIRIINRNLSDMDLYKKRRSLGSRIVDGNGALRIVRKVKDIGNKTH